MRNMHPGFTHPLLVVLKTLSLDLRDLWCALYELCAKGLYMALRDILMASLL